MLRDRKLSVKISRRAQTLTGFSLAALLLAGCGSQPAKPPSGAVSDAAPVGQFDVSGVPDAKPHAVSKVKNSPYTVLGKSYQPLATAEGYAETGISSWYGTKFHGKPTANGEVYNLYAMTAAHKTLPLPSFVRVTNLANGRQVVVRVNDRGPFHDDRIIDLSWAAAKKLDFADKGTARVKLEAISVSAGKAAVANEAAAGKKVQPALKGPSWLQVAALSSAERAKALQARLQPLTKTPVVVNSDARVHRVQLGPVRSESELRQLRQLLAQQQLGQGHLVAVQP